MGILTGSMLVSFCRQGQEKKTKNKVILNISMNNAGERTGFIQPEGGMKYKGTLLTNTQQVAPNTLMSTASGNLPEKEIIFTSFHISKRCCSEIKQGYTGLKLIVKIN